ncbi:MAG: heparin lyase I family protein [Bacteroidota bacterium]|nr:heparin lyase I family protein [Bacteroidota bacterium]
MNYNIKHNLLIIPIAFGILLLFTNTSFAQVFVNTSGATDPYKLLNSKGWYEEENTLHPGFKHIQFVKDPFLKKTVFAFIMHKDIDGNFSERKDRQRLEIKTFNKSPENMKAANGETHTYRWKFKLDEGFQPSPDFCHIHQLKAGDGDDAGAPLITITPRYGKKDKLQIIYSAPKNSDAHSGAFKEVDLAPFKGTWVEVLEKVKFSHEGSYEITIRRVSDDSILLEHHLPVLDLWRGTATFMRPKFGIYRSLKDLSYLRDETVLFADFSLYEGTDLSAPKAPSNLKGVSASDNQIKLTWSDNSNNEDQFRIEISTDGHAWRYYASANANASSYTTTDLEGSKAQYFRIRAENTAGNSDYSNVVKTSASKL